MIELTQEQAVRIGTELKRVLESKSFGTVVSIVRDDLNQRVFQSQVHEKTQRESAYAIHQGLMELLSTMASLASMAEGISLNLEDDEEDDGLNLI